jgi:bifunctional ADP-heptose synthase (sugar kinase/adenylyltransferase)
LSSKVKARPGALHADASVDLTRLLDIVALFPRRTVCVVGDVVLDQFVSGEISRISREAPVLILRHRRTEAYPGGAANAVNNLADLGAKVLPVGVVGDDNEGKILLDYFRGKRIDTSGILRMRDRATTTKTRYLAGWTHTTEQQVLRVDREPREELPERIRESLERKSRKAAKGADAVLVSDYGLGAASPEIVRKLNTKCMTLDEAAYHVTVGNDTQRLEELGRRTLRDLGLEALVVTRGKDGMSVFENGAGRQERAHNIAIYGSDAPVDVTGAGDTVIAVFTLALAAGASYMEAAHLANYAGGIVVMKRRTATVTRAELEAVLRREATAQR